jgi:two-component system sensor histidine kinase RegB
VIYGLGNLIENAVDFAESNVEIEADWDANSVNVVISDNGPGFKAEIIDSLGEPYVTTRPSGSRKSGGSKASGLGLGFFIAKTLLERSGARLSLDNQVAPLHGAVVRIAWPRYAFEASLPGRDGEEPPRPTRDHPPPPTGPVSDAI